MARRVKPSSWVSLQRGFSYHGFALCLTSDCCLFTGPIVIPWVRVPAAQRKRIANFELELGMLMDSRDLNEDWEGEGIGRGLGIDSLK
jgi:hypothetical protein